MSFDEWLEAEGAHYSLDGMKATARAIWDSAKADESERVEALTECLKYARLAIRYPWPFTGDTLAHIDSALSNTPHQAAAPKELTL